MEYFRKIHGGTCLNLYKLVLILVVMEYFRKDTIVNGTVKVFGLNPCCNGILSKDAPVIGLRYMRDVLILVVMEYFRKHFVSREYGLREPVLILVVMEYFRKTTTVARECTTPSLNPCCNGILSKVFSKIF